MPIRFLRQQTSAALPPPPPLPTPPEEEEEQLSLFEKFGPTALRVAGGVGGFALGGPLGGLAGAAGGEFLAQKLEGREDTNFAQVATQGALGAIPIFKPLSLLRGAVRGAGLGLVGAGATQLAETGEIDPKQLILPGVLGAGIGGAIGRRAGRKAIQPVSEPIPFRGPAPTEPAVPRRPFIDVQRGDPPHGVLTAQAAAGELQEAAPVQGLSLARIRQLAATQADEAAEAGTETLFRQDQARLAREVAEAGISIGRPGAGTTPPRRLFEPPTLTEAPLEQLSLQARRAALGAERVARQEGTTRAAVQDVTGGGLSRSPMIATAGGRKAFARDLRAAGLSLDDVPEDMLAALDTTAQLNRETLGREAARTANRATAAGLIDRLKRLKGDTGAIDPTLQFRLGGAVAGGLAGAATGDTPEERIERGLLGATAGAAFGPTLARFITKSRAVETVEAAKPLTERLAKFGDGIMQFRNEALLSGTAVPNAFVGALSGAVQGAMELPPAARNRVLRALSPDILFPRIAQAFKDPSINPNAFKKFEGQAQLKAFGRAIGAMDFGVTSALREGGVGADDALRLTLAGPPTTELGKKAIDAISSNIVTRLAIPFARIGVQFAERGIERSPLGLLGGGKLLPGINAGTTLSQRLIRAGVGTGVAAGGVAIGAGDVIPEEADRFLAVGAGPAALPLIGGLKAGRSLRGSQGEPLLERGARAVLEGGREAGRELPLISEFDIDPRAIARQFIPSGGRLVARALDPTARETQKGPGGEELGILGREAARIKEAIPGLRETLPERVPEVDIFGERLREPRGAVGRAFLGDRLPQGTPRDRPDDPLASALREAGVGIDPPQPTVTDEFDNPIAIPSELGLMIAQLRGRTSRSAAEQALQVVPESLDPQMRTKIIEGQIRSARTRVAGILTRLARLGARTGDFSDLQRFLTERLGDANAS